MGSNPTPRTKQEPSASEDFVNFVLWLRKKKVRGKRITESTVESKAKIIRQLKRKVNLWDKDSVRDFIEESDWCNGRKNNVLYAYQDWGRFKGFDFQFDKYRKEIKLPYIPTEQQLDQLIASFSSKYAPFLQLAKETGWRPVELSRLSPNNFDLNQQIVTLNEPAKNSMPRQAKMSNKLVAMLKPLMLGLRVRERIWKAKPRNITGNFIRIRDKVAEKFGDPNINKITIKTFRHWKATMEYSRTRDILHVMRILGHKRIQNTLVYTHLVSFESEEHICKVAASIEQIESLVSAGFQFVCDYNGSKVFRKRK